MPHASTFTRTCLAPGSGISRSTNSQSPPGLLICAAFIFICLLSLVDRRGTHPLDIGLIYSHCLRTSTASSFRTRRSDRRDFFLDDRRVRQVELTPKGRALITRGFG